MITQCLNEVEITVQQITDPIFLKKLTETVKKISITAGQEILKIYETDFEIERKEDKSPVTEADKAAHHIICDGLNNCETRFPILSEESAITPFEERKTWQTYWLVDPLDGTREFIKRNGDFTVNIALIHNKQPIIGVVYVPVTDIIYYGIAGIGAFKITKESESTIQTQGTNKTTMTIAGSRSHSNEKQQAFIQNFPDAEILAVGSSLKFCLVAEGKADIYPRFGLTSEWDTAAAQCVVEQAGGKVVTHDMKPLQYNTKESLLNPEFLAIADTNFDWSKYL